MNVVATAHNLDDVLQTFFINLYSGDLERIRWLDPTFRPSSKEFRLRRIKPMVEIYEQEIAFFAYLNGLPFQSESCPYMNEGIRTEIRLHLNELESKHPGMKYSALKTVLEISSSMQIDPSKSKKVVRCERCGAVSTGQVCSVCKTLKMVSPILRSCKVSSRKGTLLESFERYSESTRTFRTYQRVNAGQNFVRSIKPTGLSVYFDKKQEFRYPDSLVTKPEKGRTTLAAYQRSYYLYGVNSMARLVCHHLLSFLECPFVLLRGRMERL